MRAQNAAAGKNGAPCSLIRTGLRGFPCSWFVSRERLRDGGGLADQSCAEISKNAGVCKICITTADDCSGCDIESWAGKIFGRCREQTKYRQSLSTANADKWRRKGRQIWLSRTRLDRFTDTCTPCVESILALMWHLTLAVRAPICSLSRRLACAEPLSSPGHVVSSDAGICVQSRTG